jgi:hypothetical protein
VRDGAEVDAQRAGSRPACGRDDGRERGAVTMPAGRDSLWVSVATRAGLVERAVNRMPSVKSG